MASSIDALLFDFGGVFTDSPFHAVHAYGEALGTTAEQVTGVVFGSYEHDGDHPGSVSISVTSKAASTVRLISNVGIGSFFNEPSLFHK